MLNKDLLDILVCPETKCALVYKPAIDELWSVEARVAYPVRDDIPVLIAADARDLTDDELAELQSA